MELDGMADMVEVGGNRALTCVPPWAKASAIIFEDRGTTDKVIATRITVHGRRRAKVRHTWAAQAAREEGSLLMCSGPQHLQAWLGTRNLEVTRNAASGSSYPTGYTSVLVILDTPLNCRHIRILWPTQHQS
jgi:hypothetical protein